MLPEMRVIKQDDDGLTLKLAVITEPGVDGLCLLPIEELQDKGEWVWVNRTDHAAVKELVIDHFGRVDYTVAEIAELTGRDYEISDTDPKALAFLDCQEIVPETLAAFYARKAHPDDVLRLIDALQRLV